MKRLAEAPRVAIDRVAVRSYISAQMEDWPTSSEETAAPVPSRPRRYWQVHLALLTSYPILLGVLGSLGQKDSNRPLLPTEPGLLVLAMGVELLLFAVVFGLAWWASRATADELMLRWRGRVQPLIRGLVLSILLRGGLAVGMLVVGGIMAAAGVNEAALGGLRPDVEELVNAQALVKNPFYLLLNLTLVSFIVGGLREEFWRAGMLAGLAAIFPRAFQTAKGKFAAIAFVAVVFGLGHLPQGWGGVVMTGLLGLGLGWIMLHYRSIWEAAVAHGFFDASSFLLLYLIARYRPGGWG